MYLALFSTEAFEKLLEQLKGTQDGADQLELIKRAISVNTFSSDQGREVMNVMPTTFDKVGSGKGYLQALSWQPCLKVLASMLVS